MATKEQTYTDQLKALGVYDPAFDPEIRTLATMERELTRLKKAWSASAAPGEKPDPTDKLYAAIGTLRRDILTHRDALGLTPKALARLKKAEAVASDAAGSPLSQILDGIVAATGGER